MDKNWNYSGPRRFVNYSNLSPGTYIFTIKAANKDDIWSKEKVLATFKIHPPVYLTWWFILVITTVAASLIYSLYNYRKQNRKALLAIRERISRDLHDDIGSTLNSISIYSEIAKLKNTEEARREKFLEIIGSSSRDMIEQMNDIVWTINPMNDKFDKILLRMRTFASELTDGKNLQLTFSVDENTRIISLGMNERKNFYLIFKEAVNNAVKYSGATDVKVKVEMKENYLSLMIKDNGIGFDALKQGEDTAKRGGNGIRNMNLRADEINGELKITSRIGQGTMVLLNMKL